jgi:phage terminase small subunit
MSDAKPLPPNQSRFVEEYLVDLNAKQAAIRAGYSPKTAEVQGARLLRNAKVVAAIAAAKEARSARTEITQDYVLENTKEVLERCLQRAPVMVRNGREMVQAKDEDGNDVWQFDARGALGALQLLGKHVGIGGPPINLNIDFDSLTPAQLEHIANGGSVANLPRA